MESSQELPLSRVQERMWLVSQAEPDLPLYVVANACRLRGVLDVAALQLALTHLYSRHSVLRTRVVLAEDGLRQTRSPSGPFPLTIVDLSDQDANAVRGAIDAQVQGGFKLSEGPLVRGSLLIRGSSEAVLILLFHHIVVDGWSLAVMTKELEALYASEKEGRQLALSPLTLSYEDWVRRESEVSDAVRLEDLAYWRSALEQVREPLSLPFDRPRGRRQSHEGLRVPLEWDAKWYEDVRRLALSNGVTPLSVLLTAVAVMLGRAADTEDVVIGISTSARADIEDEGVVGPFLRTLPIRLRLSGRPTGIALLEQANSQIVSALSHSAVDFDDIVRATLTSRPSNHSPIFQVGMELYEARGSRIRLEGLDVEMIDVDTRTSKYDLAFYINGSDDGPAGVIEAAAALFDASTVRRYARVLFTVLKGICDSPERPVAHLALIPPGERIDSASCGEEKSAVVMEGMTVASRILLQAQRVPDLPAVLCGQGLPASLTFRELCSRATAIAGALERAGVGPGDLVGLHASRCTLMVAGVLAAWLRRAAVVPLSTNLPEVRLRRMVESVGVPVVLTNSNDESCNVITNCCRVVHMDTDRVAESRDAESVLLVPRQEDAAYVIFTSGSTGPPKGVLVQHGSLSGFATAMEQAVYDLLKPGARVSMNAPIEFDAEMQHLQLLGAGHTVVILPEECRHDPKALVALLEDSRVDVLDCTPYHAAALVSAGLIDPRLTFPRIAVVGGEAMPSALWELLRSSRIRAFNVYGPTEFTINATVAAINGVNAHPTLGHPLPNVRLSILDEGGHELPIGFPGEICLAGPQISAGYIGGVSSTALKFVPDSKGDPGSRCYATGDIGRRTSDGQVDFVGRRDNQVKLRGNRIELGEVEEVLRSAVGIVDAGAGIIDSRGETPYLFALVVGDTYNIISEARKVAEELLPGFMIPSRIHRVNRIARSPAGKRDAAALLAQYKESEQQLRVQPDSGSDISPTEAALAQLWCSVLGRSSVGADDDFFAIGGHSFLVVQLLQRVSRAFDVSLPISSVFQSPTLAGLAKAIDSARSRSPAVSTVVRIREGVGDHSLVLAHPLGGTLLAYGPLVRALPDELPVFGVQSRTQVLCEDEAATVEEMLARYADDVESHVPSTSLSLLGWSLGGLVALGLAGELESRGHHITLVELWDCGVSAAAPLKTGEVLSVALRASFGAAMAEVFDRAGIQDIEAWLRPLSTLSPEARLSEIVRFAQKYGLPKDASAKELGRQVGWMQQQTNLFRAWTLPPLCARIHAVFARRSIETGVVENTDWSSLTVAGYTHSIVEGDHYSMMRSPVVRETASQFVKRMEAGYGPQLRR